MAGTVVCNVINTDTGLFSTNNAYSGIAKAWGNFSNNGSTITVNASFNVSSITRNGTGQMTINLTTPLTSTNSVFVGNASNNNNITIATGTFTSTSAITMYTYYGSSTAADASPAYFAIFGA